MSKGAVIAVAVIVGLLVFGGLAGLTIVPPPQSGNMPVTFTVTDLYSSTAIPDTSDLYVYVLDGLNLVPRDAKLDLTSGDVDSVQSYRTGETLKIKVVDPTDTSYNTVYFTWIVPAPSASELETAKFKCDLGIVNMDDANNDGTIDWDPAVEENNGTALAASGTVDVSNCGYDASYAYWNIFIYNNDDNTGYLPSYNFEDQVQNNAYLYLQFSGTGWDRTAIRDGAVATFERNNILYAMVPLTQDALSRDNDVSAGFVGLRDGNYKATFTLDFTAYTGGDSVTFGYGIRYYSDWANFVDTGSWGIDSVAIAETMTIQI